MNLTQTTTDRLDRVIGGKVDDVRPIARRTDSLWVRRRCTSDPCTHVHSAAGSSSGTRPGATEPVTSTASQLREHDDTQAALKMSRKIINWLIINFHGIYSSGYSLLPRAPQSGRRGHDYKLMKRRCRSQLRANFFSFRVVNLWNRLPSDLVSAPSVNASKSRLDNYWKGFCYTLDPEDFL